MPKKIRNSRTGPPDGHPPYPGCETGGRPEHWTLEQIDHIADLFLEFIELPTTLYFKEFFTWFRQKEKVILSQRTFYRFIEKSEKFSEIFEYAKVAQESKIARGGMLKKLDSGMCKFMLSAVHGMSDKQTIEHQGNEIIQVINYSDQELKTWKEETKSKGN
jgi:hypothetical protein